MLRKLSISIIIGLALTIPLISWAQNAPQISNLQALIQQLQEQIKVLQEQVVSLQTQLKTTREEVAEVKAELKITRSLQQGATGDEVTALQEFLKKFPDIYPEGLVTGYFGPRTEAAVKKLQERQGIDAIGIVGPKTLKKINELLSEGTGASSVIPPGLLIAPGIQGRLEIATTTTAQTTTTIPVATPAVPAVPAQPSSGAGFSAISATPAVPAQPATTATSTTPTATTTDTVAPSVPTNFSAYRYGSNGISVYFTWTDTSNNELGFTLSRKPPSESWYRVTESDYAYAANATQTGVATDYSTTVGTYDYKLNACNTYGCSTNSNIASVTYTAATYAATPSNLTATANGSSVNLSWIDNATNETEYRVYQLASNGSVWAPVGVGLATNTTSWVHSGVTAGTYRYRVNACSAPTSCSLSSNQPTVTVGGGTVDTTPPAISSMSVSSSTQTSATIIWITNEPSDSQAEYGVMTSYGSVSALDTTLTTSHSITLSGLSAGATYHYRVKSKDGSNNLAVSSDQVFTTAVAKPLAPTNVQTVTTASAQNQPPQMWYYMVFNYTLQSATQSFNVYRKRPTDASFVKYIYSAQTPVNPSILPLPGSGESNLYHRDPNQWSWYTTLPAPAPESASGEYQFYVTAVDTSGVESDPSLTKSLKLYAAPVISSPADGSMVSSPFTITVVGDPNALNPTYGMALYKKIMGDTAWSAWPAPSTNFTYPGPALNPSDNPHRLVVWLSADGSSFHGTSIFNVATTSPSTITESKLATILFSLAAIVQELQRLLR